MYEKLKIILANKLRLPVKYDDEFFKPDWFENWNSLSHILSDLIKHNSWQNILDFGCGPGIMIDLMNKQGIDYVGCDYSVEAKKLYMEHYAGYPERYTSNLQSKFLSDRKLFIAFDVFEHMTDSQISLLLEEMPMIPELFLNISRALAIPGHINIKNDEQWIKYFKRQGFILDDQKTKSTREMYLKIRPQGPDLWHKNMFIFKRGHA